MRDNSFIKYCLILALSMYSAIICYSQSKEATVKIKAKNTASYDLTYHRSYSGV